MAEVRTIVAIAGAALGIAMSCGEFRSSPLPEVADAAPEGGLPDAPATDDAPSDDAPTDDAPADDAGANDAPADAPADSPDAMSVDSPPDTECSTPWTAPDAQAACPSRGVFVLEPGVIDTRTVSIAVTGTKRVGVAYNAMLFADQGELHVANFDRPATPPPPADGGLSPAPRISVIAGTQFDNVGFVADIAAGGDALLRVAFQQVPANEIDYATIDTSGPPSASEPIATGISQPSGIALGVLPSGDVRVAYYDPGQAALLSKLRAAAGGAWDVTPSTIRGDFLQDSGVPGIGRVDQVIDEVGSAHVAYHFPRVSRESEPSYAQYATAAWGMPLALEAPETVAGFGISLGLTGQTRRAAYFVVPFGSSTAELHLASWISLKEIPHVDVLARDIPTSADPAYRAALATDKYGLVHIALLRPTATNSWVLEYRRQTRVAGNVSWLVDVVDTDVVAPDSLQTLVAIAVDADARPHIAYYRGTDLSLRYATRFDRP